MALWLNPQQLKYCGGALICIGALIAAISGIAYLQANQTVRKSAVDARRTQTFKDQSPDRGYLAFIFVLGKLTLIGGAVLVRNANEMQPAVEAEPVPLSAAIEQEPSSRQASSPQPARRTHWAIHTIAVVVGLVFFLVGCLCLPVGVKQYVQAAASEGLNHAVHIIVIFLMAGMMLFGAFLVWFPLRRTKPTISIVPQTSAY